jgi:antitoxin MazE
MLFGDLIRKAVAKVQTRRMRTSSSSRVINPACSDELDTCGGIFDVYPEASVETVMQVQVARWGNSLGLRIPKDVAQRIGLRAGARVDVETEGNRIIISPARPRYVLADLLKGMTPKAMREAFDWGPDRGREIVE